MRTEPSYNVVGHEDDFARHRPQRLGASSTDDDDDNDKSDVRSQSKTIESKAMHQASWTSCVINLSSTILGAGILGVPYAISMMGWIPGLLSLTISALLSAFGLHLMAECALQLPGASSFYAVALFTVPELATMVDILVTVKGFGTVTAYVLVIADSLTLAFKSSPWLFLRSRFWVISLSYLIIGPLSYFPSLDSLKFSSALSVVMVFVLTLMIIVYSMHAKNSIFDPCPMTHTDSPDEMVCSADSVVFAGKASSFLRAFPIFLFGFTCQQNAFTVVNELKDPTRKRLNSIFITSIASSWAVNMVVGICGYATFGAMTHSDILKNYPENALTSTCRVLMALVVICHYPLQLHPSRRTALSLWQRFVPPASSVPASSAANSMTSSLGSVGGGLPVGSAVREQIDEEAVVNQSTSYSPLTTVTALSPTRHLPSPLTPHSPTPLLSSSTNDAVSSGATMSSAASPTAAAAAAATVDAKTFQRRFFLYTTFFNVVVYCISISVDDLGVVLSLLGATMSCIVILLLPGIFYGRLAARLMAPKDDFRLNTFVGIQLPSLSSIMQKFGLKPSVTTSSSSTSSSLNMVHGGSRNHNHNPLHAYQHTPDHNGTINDRQDHGSFDDDDEAQVVELTSVALSSPHQRKINRRAVATASDDAHTLSSPVNLVGGVSLVPTSSSLSTWSEHGLIASDDADGAVSPFGTSRVSARVSHDVLPGVRWKRYAAWSIVGFGLIVLCVSLASILSSSSSSSGSH